MSQLQQQAQEGIILICSISNWGD